MSRTPPAPAFDTRSILDQAIHALTDGRIEDAARIANRILATHPRAAQAHRIAGVCHLRAGHPQAAEASFRKGFSLDPSDEALALDLADTLVETAQEFEAERVLRRALGANRRSARLAARLAQLLTGSGRADEAISILAKPAAAISPDYGVLVQTARAQKANGKIEAAAATYKRAVVLLPDDAVAHHNLAAILGDLGRYAASLRSASKSLGKGGSAPETWLVYARALLGTGRLDEAERAFRETIARRPTYIEAHRELAQLIWMRTEDQRAATATLDAHILDHPHVHELFGIRASVMHHAGDVPNAYATLLQAIRRHPDQAALYLSASQLAAKLDGGAGHAVDHAMRAMQLLPGNDEAAAALIAACLAAGQPKAASTAAAQLLDRHKLDQRVLAYQATAWRMLGDARYGELYDYAAFVRPYRMDVPEGWASLEAYLADLAGALAGLHPFRTHPLEQSVRHGSQATHLLASENPTIRAFFQAVDGPIRRHLAELGQGRDPLRRRNTGGFKYHGAWSVRLRPGGFHTDHIHPEGWLSSACYIALPPPHPGSRPESREAWIKFGQPGTPTAPSLEAEHYVQPEPGTLVLFPSYMWHGTVPFSADANRLSIAFDLVPA